MLFLIGDIIVYILIFEFLIVNFIMNREKGLTVPQLLYRASNADDNFKKSLKKEKIIGITFTVIIILYAI